MRRKKGLPLRAEPPCGAQSDYSSKSGNVTPQHFRYIGLHRPNMVKKEGLACFPNQAVLPLPNRIGRTGTG